MDASLVCAHVVKAAIAVGLIVGGRAACAEPPATVQLGNYSAAENRSAEPPATKPDDEPPAVLRLEVSPQAAAITALSWDTEGGGRAKTNLLRGPVRLDAKIGGKKISLDDCPVQFTRPSAGCARYQIAAEREISVSWEIRAAADRWSFVFDWTGARQRGLEELEVIFPLDPGATPTTFVSEHWAGRVGTRLPGIFSAPDLGQFLVTSPDQPNLNGRLEGSRAKKTVDLIFELPVDAAGQGCTVQCSRLLLPLPPGVDPATWVKARRGWFNLFNLSAAWTRPNGSQGAPAGVFANNVISDPVTPLLYCHSDPVVLVPELAPGVNAARVLRRTLDFWLRDQVAENGRVHYIPEEPGAKVGDGNPSLGGLVMDGNPALLIAVWSYVTTVEDRDWFLANIDRIELVAEYIAARDVDHDGLVESEQPANTGDKSFGDTYMDTISSGHKNALCNALAYRAWRHLSDLEGLVGRREQQQRYLKLALALRAAYDQALYNSETGRYGWWRSADGTLHDYAALIVNCYAVECGVVDRRRGRQILNGLWAKLEQVGFDRFDLGVPNNLIPVRRDDQYQNFGGQQEDGSDTFEHYCNGGVFPEDAIRCIAALLRVGESDKAFKIFNAMLERQHRGGVFPNGSGFNAGVTNRPNSGPSISDWQGNPTEYEGFIPRDYAFLCGAMLCRPEFRAKLYPYLAAEDSP